MNDGSGAAKAFWRKIAALLVFASAFGYVEAAVVVYLRALYDPMRRHFNPAMHPGDLFPLLSLTQLQSLGPDHVARLATELGRELATLIMLAAVAFVAEKKWREWVGAFLFCFGVWDIVFYLTLKLILNWPASLLTWDILFLLPVPWVGPVIAPVIVSNSMLVCGAYVIWRAQTNRPIPLRSAHWYGIAAGGLLTVLAFMWDYKNTASGGFPNQFNWVLFSIGEIMGVFSFAAAAAGRPKSLEIS